MLNNEGYVSILELDSISEGDVNEPDDGGENKEDDNVQENLAKEMLGLSVEMVTSGKYKRKLEARDFSKGEVENLMTRVAKKIRAREGLVSDSSSSDSEVSVEGVQNVDEDMRQMVEPEILKSIIISQELSAVRRPVREEQPSVKLETRKQRVKYCIRLKNEAKYLHVQNLILQRKIAQIALTRKQLVPRGPSHTSIGGKDRRTTLKKEYKENLLEYDDLKLSLVRLKESLEADLVKRRKRKDILKCALRTQKEAFRNYWLSEITKLRSVWTGKTITVEAAEELLRSFWTKLDLLKREHFKYVMSYDESAVLSDRVTTLEVFGEDAHIDDYERIERQCHKLKDHIEDRGEQLKLLKEKATSNLQEAAHLKDFIQGVEEEIAETQVELDEVNLELDEIRRKVTMYKRKRDRVRRKTKRISEEIELLDFKPLLKDFMFVRAERKRAEAKLNYLKTVEGQQERKIRDAWEIIIRIRLAHADDLPDVLTMLEDFLEKNGTMPHHSKRLRMFSKSTLKF